MRKLTKGSIATGLVYGLVLAVALPGFAWSVATAQADPARVKVIILPLANNTQVGGPELASRVYDALRTTLAASDRATIIGLRLSSPPVRRAINIDKTLDPSDLDIKPPANRAQAERIGRALGADLVLWGSIEEYTRDAKAKQVTVGLSIYKLDLRADQVNAIAVTGKNAAKVGFEGGEGPLMNEAIDAAVLQVAQQALGAGIVTGPKRPAPAPAITRKKDRTWQYVAGIAAIAAIAAIASGGGGAAAPPQLPDMVTEAIATPTANSVELSWKTATGATTITSFNIFRAEMGGTARTARVARAAHSRVRLTRQAGGYSLLASVGKGDRIYNDVSANIGTLYAYKIAAVVGSVESAQVDFYNYYELQRGAVGVIEVGPAWPTAPAMPFATAFLQSVSLQWTKNPEDFISSYRVYRSTSATGPWDSTTFLGQVSATQNTFEDATPGLVPGNVYYYAIGAVTAATSANGRIGPALQFTFTPGKPAPPSDVRAEPLIEGVLLTWTVSPDSSVTGYRIFRNGTQIAQIGLLTNYTDSPLAAGSYSYAVAAVAGSGAGAVESDRIAAVPSPVSPSSPPNSLVITPLTGPVVANNTSTIDIFATATAAGTPVQGVDVVFSTTTDDGTLVVHPAYATRTTEVPAGLRVTTDAAGKAAVRFRAGTEPAPPHAQPVVTAQCVGAGGVTLEDSVTVTLQAPQIASISLVADRTLLPGDGLSFANLTATVVDQGGGGMESVVVHFLSEAPTLGVFNPSDATHPESFTASTGTDGTATAKLQSAASGQFGSCAVTATAVGAPAGTPPGRVVINFAAAPRVSVSIDPSILPAAGLGSSALITATVKFATGDPVPDGTIMRFAFQGGETMSTTGALIASGRERALTQNGVAYSTLLSAVDLTHGESDTIMVWMDSNDNGVLDSGEPSGGASVTYTYPPVTVAVTADPVSIPADGRSVSRIVADVRTDQSNPSGGGKLPVADGTLVEIRTDLGTFMESGTGVVGARTVGGLVSGFLKAGSQQGTANVTATAALVSGSTRVAFAAPVNTVVSVVATPASMQANGTDTSQITVRVTDKVGSPIAGTTVDLAVNLGTLTSVKGTTDATGTAKTTFTAGTVSGTATLVATANGATGLTTITLTSGQPQNTALTILAPNVIMPATNGLPSPAGVSPTAMVVARVTDKYGNPVVNGTPVFFHTDIGQVDGSALTTNGAAQATLVSASFTDATNKATFRPGWASVTAYANGPNGPATAGPEYQIFCGDLDAVNWDGSANDTNVFTGYGADWRLGTTGSSTLNQPNVVPRAGGTFRAAAVLADRNNNPLPAGVKVHWTFEIGSTVVASVDDTTGIVVTNSGVQQCISFADVTPTKFPSTVTVADMTITAEVPGVVVAGVSKLGISQLVGAAGPSGAIKVISVVGSPIPMTGNPDGPFTITAAVIDQYGNPVQDGTPVYFGTENVTNAIVSFNPNPAFTVGGTATTGMQILLLDETANATFNVLAGSPQAPPGADANGSLSITANAPPQPVRTVLVNYDLFELVGPTLGTGSPDPNLGPWFLLPPGGFSFSVQNVGQARSTVTIANVLDPAGQSAPAQYITFRQNISTPPSAYGDTALTLVLDVGQKTFVDVILNTTGLLTNTPYTSDIVLSATDGTVITYGPATRPQKIRVVVP
jgi:hypothetical protein